MRGGAWTLEGMADYPKDELRAALTIACDEHDAFSSALLDFDYHREGFMEALSRVSEHRYKLGDAIRSASRAYGGE